MILTLVYPLANTDYLTESEMPCETHTATTDINVTDGYKTDDHLDGYNTVGHTRNIFKPLVIPL